MTICNTPVPAAMTTQYVTCKSGSENKPPTDGQSDTAHLAAPISQACQVAREGIYHTRDRHQKQNTVGLRGAGGVRGGLDLLDILASKPSPNGQETTISQAGKPGACQESPATGLDLGPGAWKR